jgi:choline-glycine betaine transporter
MADESTFRRISRMIAWQLLAGLVLGVLFWELFGQALLSMKYGSVGSSVTCAPDVKRALAEFDSGLRLSAIVGALAFVALLALIRRQLRKRSESRLGGAATGAGHGG